VLMRGEQDDFRVPGDHLLGIDDFEFLQLFRGVLAAR
jgi:hypothetical protein